MNLSSITPLKDLQVAHKWFAWKPVLVERKGIEGQIYCQVQWFCFVNRTLVRISGVSVFKYEPI